jgi:hypothetical protein
MLLDQQISLFKDAAKPTGFVNVSLGKFLQSTRHLPLINAVRAIADKKVRDEMKKALPAATISGTFRERRMAANIEKYNGLVCLDFDGGDHPDFTPDTMKEVLQQYAEVAYAGLSVSGTGVFAIIPTDNPFPEKHAATTRLVGRLFADEGLVFDPSCTDVSRLRFVSFDPDPVVNLQAWPFEATKYLQAPPPAQPRNMDDVTGNTVADRVERRLRRIEAQMYDATQVYEDWYRIGFALSSEFGPAGEEYFHRASQFHPKYERPAVARFYEKLCQKSTRIQIGTFFHLTKGAAL